MIMKPPLLLPAVVYDIFLSCLSPADLINFSQTSKGDAQAVESFIRRTFRINRILNRYFTPAEILTFRYLQSQTQMFISGSTALQFFDRITYPHSDLDIYVEHRYRRTIVVWLTSIGYTFKPRTSQEPDPLEESMEWDNSPSGPFLESESIGYFGRGVVNVYNFVRGDPQRKIQLITSGHSPLEIVLNFHSTCVMNLITHDKAYALYPKGTFTERRSLMYSTEGLNQETARKKYKTRGWAMVERLTAEELNDPKSAFASGNRYVGDSKCWTISLHPKLDLPESLIETNTWALKYDAELVPIMSFRILFTDCLNFSYLVGDEALAQYISPIVYPPEVWKKDLDRDILKLIRWRRSPM